jgi:hypothetical protein
MGMTFKCSNAVGATLLLRSTATSVDFGDNNIVHQYIAEHIDSWYDHAWNLGYQTVQAPEGSIVLIKGCVKTGSWAHATFTERTKEASIFFNGGLVKELGVTTRLRGSWARATSTVYGEGPLEVDGEHLLLENEPGNSLNHFPANVRSCVFARMYRCKRRPGFGPIRRTVGIRVGDKSSSKKLPDLVSVYHTLSSEAVTHHTLIAQVYL